MHSESIAKAVEYWCCSDDLSTYDPYDIWKTRIGLKIKDLYNKNSKLALLPAACLGLLDLIFNSQLRGLYSKQEYPIVRALAVQALINIASYNGNELLVLHAKRHIDWLVSNSCYGYSGCCWGLGFTWPAGKDLVYDANTPFTTHTPYVLEAIHKYIELSGDTTYVSIIESIYAYYENDVKVLHETERSIGISYGPFKDRLITNAVSYALYAYTIFSLYLDKDREYINEKIEKLFTFVEEAQLGDGSWLYEPFNNNTFIDCFHSCFIIKNIHKANQIYPLEGCDIVVNRGYNYVVERFSDNTTSLMVRFSKSNKPSFAKFDLYDNAEFMNLALMMGDIGRYKIVEAAVKKNFVSGYDVYSLIDVFRFKRSRNCLRWAVMPYVYTLSCSIGLQ